MRRLCLHCGAPVELVSGMWVSETHTSVHRVLVAACPSGAGHVPRDGEFEQDATGQYIPVIQDRERQIQAAYGLVPAWVERVSAPALPGAGVVMAVQGICTGCKTESFVVDGLCTYCQRLAEQTRKTADIDARRGAAVTARPPFPWRRAVAGTSCAMAGWTLLVFPQQSVVWAAVVLLVMSVAVAWDRL